MKHLLLSVLIGSLIVGACGGGTQPTAVPTSANATPVPATVGPTPTLAPTRTATAQPVPSGEIRFALSTLSTFPTLNGYAGVARSYLDAMYDYSIGEKDGKPDPESGFATSWILSADGKTHTLKFRNDVFFHNGDKATARDVIWSIDFARSGTIRAASPSTAKELNDEIASITAPDDTTLVVQLSRSQIFWHIFRLCRIRNGQAPSYLSPEKYMKSMSEEAAAKAPVGSGPFKFKSLNIDNNVVFEATERHWFHGVPRVKTMEYRVIPEESTRLALIQGGGADLIGISRTPVPLVRKDAKLTIFLRENSGVGAYKMEEQSVKEYPGYGPNPLADVRVRRAMDRYAIDRQVLVDSFLNGLGNPTFDYPITVADPAWTQLPPAPKRDVAQAKRLMAEAGFPNGFQLDMYVWSGLQPPEGVDIMEAIAVWWGELGITINRKPSTLQSFGLSRPNTGWPRPTVAGIWFLGNNPVAAASAAVSHDPALLNATNLDPNLDRLGKTWAFSANEADYIKNGRAYMLAAYESVGPTSGGNALFYVGDIFVGNDKIPKTWKLGRAQYSFQLEQVGLRI